MLRTNDAMTKTKGNYIRDENKVAGSRKSFGDSALATPSPRHGTTGVLSSTGLTRRTTKNWINQIVGRQMELQKE